MFKVNLTYRTISDIEFICNPNLIKISEHKKYFLVCLNMDKIGLDLSYKEICSVMEKFSEKIQFCSDLRGIKSLKLHKHKIILEKY